jgi:hypothetical protein
METAVGSSNLCEVCRDPDFAGMFTNYRADLDVEKQLP